jgi:Na+-translocating ferredoxin:NAD+ oxidoreductase RnfC subunit
MRKSLKTKAFLRRERSKIETVVLNTEESSKKPKAKEQLMVMLLDRTLEGSTKVKEISDTAESHLQN